MVEQVRVLGFDVTPQCLDPGLVGRGVGPAEVLADRQQRHERPGLTGAHLGAVVGHGEQDRGGVVVEVDVVGVVEAPLQPVEQPFGLQAGQEHDLDLGPGRLGAEQAGDPLAGDDVDDAVHDRGGRARREVRGVPAPQLVRPPLDPVRATASSTSAPAGECLAAQGRCGPGPGPPSRATPTPDRCRSRGGRACDARGRSVPTPRTAPGSRPPPRPGARGSDSARCGVVEAVVGLAVPPAPRPLAVQLQHPADPTQRPAAFTASSIRSNRTVLAACRLGLGSGRSTPGCFSPQGRQLDRLLHDRGRQPLDLGP